MADANWTEVNPYAAPQVEQPARRPEVGAWRDGSFLVMHKDAELPRFCVHTGQRAAGACLWPACWKSAGNFFSRHQTIYLPLCREHLQAFARNRRLSRIGLLLAAGAIGLPVLLAAVWIPLINRWAPVASFPLACVVLGIVGVTLWTIGDRRTSNPLVIAMSRGDHLWLGGVHPAFLDRLPPWPHGA